MKTQARLLIAGLDILTTEAAALKTSVATLLEGNEPDTLPSECIKELDDAIAAYSNLRNDWTEIDDIDMDDMDVSFSDNDREYED